MLVSTVVKEYAYVYTGGSLVQMIVTTTVDGGTPTRKTVNFAYDASGVPMSVTYNGTTYYYATNLQGDVTAILNTSGTAVVTYTYDAWGNILTTGGSMASTLGPLNPLRYRGYVYDTETGFYYLQSRYYDPAIGRFINADAYASTGQGLLGNNMFAYCNNNPVSSEDPQGASPRQFFAACLFESRTGTPRAMIADTTADQKYGTINGQASLPYATEKIGLGSYATSGCAVIAVYNAMQLLNQPQPLGNIADDFVWKYGTIAFGAGGVGPWSIEAYFDAYGVPYIGSYSMTNLTKDISEGSIIVFTVMNSRWNPFDGFHTMTAQYTNGAYNVYNVSGYSSDSEVHTSLYEVYSGGVWIYGYRIH